MQKNFYESWFKIHLYSLIPVSWDLRETSLHQTWKVSKQNLNLCVDCGVECGWFTDHSDDWWVIITDYSEWDPSAALAAIEEFCSFLPWNVSIGIEDLAAPSPHGARRPRLHRPGLHPGARTLKRRRRLHFGERLLKWVSRRLGLTCSWESLSFFY